jgi:hypothetical protein
MISNRSTLKEIKHEPLPLIKNPLQYVGHN